MLVGAGRLRCALVSELLTDAEFVVDGGGYDGTILLFGGDVDFGGECPAVGVRLFNALVLATDGFVGVKLCGM